MVINVATLTDPTGETFANVDDLLALFRDIKDNPENYNKDAVVRFIGQLAGKIPIEKETSRIPF